MIDPQTTERPVSYKYWNAAQREEWDHRLAMIMDGRPISSGAWFRLEGEITTMFEVKPAMKQKELL